MNKMSTGQDSTLGNHRRIAAAKFGEESPAIAFLDKKIAEAAHGADEPVICDEGQLVYLLGKIHQRETK